MYSHCNICNIPIYFYNIQMKHLQDVSETYERIETYVCNIGRGRGLSILAVKVRAGERSLFGFGNWATTLDGLIMFNVRYTSD